MSRHVVLLLAAALLAPVSSRAQGVFDHLKCHKVRDSLRFPETTVDLDALQAQFSDTGCKIRKRAKLFCAPVTKTNADPPPPLPQIAGPALDTDFVCYKVKCPIRPGDEEVSDQFGTRTLVRMRSDLLCVPAVKGPPPAPVCGNGVIEGGEWCDGDEFCESNCTIRRFACCEFDTPSGSCSGDVPPLTLVANQFQVCGSYGGTFYTGRVEASGGTCTESVGGFVGAETGACVAPPPLAAPASVCCRDLLASTCSDITTDDQEAIGGFVWSCLYQNYPDFPVVAGTCGAGGECEPAH